MSISSTVSRNDYLGTGAASVYSYTFKINSSSDLRVLTRSTLGVETTLTLNTDYTVSGVGNKTGGSITLVAGNLATGVTLTIRRVLPLTQNTDIRNQGDYYPEVIEDTFDRLTFQDQQQQDHLNRTVSLPQTVTASEFDPKLPSSIIGKPNLVVATNPTGNGFTAGPTLADISTAISLVPTVTSAVTATGANVTAAAASATAAATSATAAAGSASTAAGSVTEAQGFANNSATSASTSIDAATLSKDWANKTSGNVDGSEFSSKYYAQLASATVASKVNRAGDTMTGPLGIQSILRLEQEINSALTGANVTLAPTRSNYKITGAVTSIQAITPPANPDGALLVVTNGIGSSFTVRNNAGAGNNSIATGTGDDIALATGATLWLVYDNSSTVWRVIGGTGSGGGSLPNGGTLGQVLAKNSSTNGDASWYTLDKTSVGLGNVDNTSDASKTVLNAQNLLGVNPIANGGTGATTRQAALNALSGAQSNATFLRSDGTNTGLSSIQASDVPTLNQNTTGNAATATTAGSITGVNPIANGGTGQTTAQAALDALVGTQTNARYLRSNGTTTTLSQVAASELSGTVPKVNGGTGADNTNLVFPTTGTLATVGGTETLAAKTLNSAVVQNQLQFLTLASSPAAPVAGRIFLYAKTSDSRLYYQTPAGLEQPVQGARVQKNYLLGGDGETGLGQTGAGYNDTAVPTSVVTGGTKRITITSSSPLSGANSLLFTASAAIGGDAIPFSVDRGDFGQVLQGDITLELGGTGYVDGALQFWIVAPSGQVIQPSGTWSVNAFTGIGRVRFTFQTEVTGSQYYLKVHQSTTVNTWTAKMEMRLVSQITSSGSFTSDWTSYTPTINGFGTTSSGSFQWRRVSDSIEVKGKFLTGTPTAVTAQIFLPAGLTIDSSKVPGTMTAGSWYRNGVDNDFVILATGGVNYLTVGATTARFNSVLGNVLAAGSEVEGFHTVAIPIAGWSSSQVLSSDAGDGRLISFSGNSGTNQALTGGTTAITFDSIKDSASAWNGSQYSVTTPGDYQFFAYFVNASTTSFTVGLFVNGTLSRNILFTPGAVGGIGSGGATLVNLKAGDIVTLRSDTSPTVGGRNLYIHRISTGNQQIAASESVSARATNTAGTTIGTTPAIVPFANKTYDTHGSLAVSGIFTAAAPGKYLVSAILTSAPITLNTAQQFELLLYKNGAFYSELGTTYGNGANILPRAAGSDSVRLLAGETIAIYAVAGATTTLYSSQDGYNRFAIDRIGNY